MRQLATRVIHGATGASQPRATLLFAGAAFLLAGCPDRDRAEPEAPEEEVAPSGGEASDSPATSEARAGDPEGDAGNDAKPAEPVDEIPADKDLADQARSHSKSFRLLRPTPGEGIRSPLRVEGAARVFEGAFQIELEDGHDVVAHQLMQVEAAPAWGSFAIDLEYERPSSPAGTLILYYESAKDGSRVEELRVPVAFLDRPLADSPT